ncbi:tetratricopeptide repeat protein [Sedimenticola selenatireducens]|uniref:Tetratricopeptide repeat protein n=1 Tax=Sedimenticola selenatireducens TaxID=191960 RepID=A0A558DRX8_9GAMM|nr:tetratricopeptide repeat protein [Sedimenticola selenatireducens]TVO75951.1 tetratricopeptide repeat protein [Sedimenticola selenatireducens]TVT63810.1 MAG: tetratricopeptide repeat protein [Sedimenticola selenatireducens]
MSLINQMLRDLDKRENESEKAREIVTPVPVPQRSGAKRGVRWPIWIVFAGLASVLSVILVPQSQQWLSGMLNAKPAVSDTPLTLQDKTDSSVSRTSDSVTVSEQIPLKDLKANDLVDDRVMTISDHSVEVDPIVRPEDAASKNTLLAEVAHPKLQVQSEYPQRTSDQPKTVSDQLDEPTSQHAIIATASIAEADQSEKGRPRIDTDKVVAEQVSAPAAQIIASKSAQPKMPVEQQQEIKSVIQVKKVTPRRVQASADSVYQTALQFLNEGNLSDAEASLRHVLTLDQRNHEARRILAMLLLNAGERGEFTSLLNEGIQMAPGHAPFVTLLSRALLDFGENAKAIHLLERHLPTMGDDAELLELLGSLYQQSGQYAAAILRYRQLLERQPDNARAVAGLAISLDASGKQGEALSLYKQALNYRSLPDEVNEYARQRVLALSVER